MTCTPVTRDSRFVIYEIYPQSALQVCVRVRVRVRVFYECEL